MAVGKNKRLSKGKKGKGKKVIDPFTKKEWYDIKAPSNFSVRACGKTPVTRTTGTKIASEMLKGRVFEICLADLNKDEDHAFRKFQLQCEEVQGRFCLTQFLLVTAYVLNVCTALEAYRSPHLIWQSASSGLPKQPWRHKSHPQFQSLGRYWPALSRKRTVTVTLAVMRSAALTLAISQLIRQQAM